MFKKIIAIYLVLNLMVTGGTIVSAQEGIQGSVENQKTNDVTPAAKQEQTKEVTVPQDDTLKSDVKNNSEAPSKEIGSNISQPSNDSKDKSKVDEKDPVSTQQQTIYREASQNQKGDGTKGDVSQQQSITVQNGQQQQADSNGNLPADKQNISGQDQVGKTNQSQAAKDISDIQQNQWTTNYFDSLQTVHISTDKAEQDQTARLQATQIQLGSSATAATLNQKQDVAAHLAQVQLFIAGEGGHQDTNITTGQIQYTGLESKAEVVLGQETKVSSNQHSNLSDTKQEDQQTEISNVQVLGVQTSGSAILGQSQQTDVAGSSTTTTDHVHAETKNLVSIIKSTWKTVVQVVQSININGKTESFQNEYELNQDNITQSQEYAKTFDWGLVAIGNYASVRNFANDVLSNVSSFISIIFSPKKPLPDNPGNGQGGNQPGDPGNGQDGNQPGNPGNGQDGNQPSNPGNGQGGNQPGNPGNNQNGNKNDNLGNKQDQPKNEGKLIVLGNKSNQQIKEVSSSSIQNTTSESKLTNDKGIENQQQQLPDTATNTFNNLLIGLGLLVGSGCLYITIRKKAMKN